MEFLPRAQVLTIEELVRTARLFTELGVRKIRVTGGEPLIRRGVDELFTGLGNLPGLETLALTTIAQVFASSVLPTPGGPSINTGFSSAAANRTTVAIRLVQM